MILFVSKFRAFSP